MKRTALGIFIALLVLVGAGAVYLLQPRSPHPSPDAARPSGSSVKATPEASISPAAQASGAYVMYRPGILAETNGRKVLFFYDPECMQCQELDESIQAGPIPDNTTIIKVDYDANLALRRQYGVTAPATVVRVDDSGKAVQTYAAHDTPSLDALVKNVLP